MRKVHVIATNTVPRKDLHEDDQYVAGTYSVTFSENVDLTKAADAALDGFHSNIPVRSLDDFKFEAKTPEGEYLAVDPEHESYSLEGVVLSVEQL